MQMQLALQLNNAPLSLESKPDSCDHQCIIIHLQCILIYHQCISYNLQCIISNHHYIIIHHQCSFSFPVFSIDIRTIFKKEIYYINSCNTGKGF